MHVWQSHEMIWSPLVLRQVRGTIRHRQEPDRSRCRDSASSVQWRSSARYEGALWGTKLYHLSSLLYTSDLILTESVMFYTEFGVIRCADRICNNLPLENTSVTSLTVFKHKLKHQLFDISYNDWLGTVSSVRHCNSVKWLKFLKKITIMWCNAMQQTEWYMWWCSWLQLEEGQLRSQHPAGSSAVRWNRDLNVPA